MRNAGVLLAANSNPPPFAFDVDPPALPGGHRRSLTGVGKLSSSSSSSSPDRVVALPSRRDRDRDAVAARRFRRASSASHCSRIAAACAACASSASCNSLARTGSDLSGFSLERGLRDPGVTSVMERKLLLLLMSQPL